MSERQRLTLKGDSSPVLLSSKFGSSGDPAPMLTCDSGGNWGKEGSNSLSRREYCRPSFLES